MGVREYGGDHVSRGAGQRGQGEKTGTVVLGSESNFLWCCTYLAEPKFLTIPKGTGLTDQPTDAALTSLAFHNHSILIPICTQEEGSTDGYA